MGESLVTASPLTLRPTHDMLVAGMQPKLPSVRGSLSTSKSQLTRLVSSTIATIYCSEFLAFFQRLLTTVVQSVRKREADVSKCATFV